MEGNNLLLVVAVVAVACSLVGAYMSYASVSNFQSWLTGFATETAIVNITISSSTVLNFTDDFISFGTGTVNASQTYAIMNTFGYQSGGTWAAPTDFLNLSNIGNTNVNLSLYSDKSAATFIGGTGPWFQYNYTFVGASCHGDVGYRNSSWQNFTVGASTTSNVCSNFTYTDGADQMRIDIQLRVPEDSFKSDIPLTATVTADYVAIA